MCYFNFHPPTVQLSAQSHNVTVKVLARPHFHLEDWWGSTSKLFKLLKDFISFWVCNWGAQIFAGCGLEISLRSCRLTVISLTSIFLHRQLTTHYFFMTCRNLSHLDGLAEAASHHLCPYQKKVMGQGVSRKSTNGTTAKTLLVMPAFTLAQLQLLLAFAHYTHLCIAWRHDTHYLIGIRIKWDGASMVIW